MFVEILGKNIAIGAKDLIILSIDAKELIIFGEEMELFFNAIIVGSRYRWEIFQAQNRVDCKVIAAIIPDRINSFISNNESKSNFLI